MADREWTGSVANLPESMRAFAVEMANLANEEAAELKSDERHEVDAALERVVEFLRDHAYTLSEWGDAVEQLYARLDAPAGAGDFTNAQALAVGRIALRPPYHTAVWPTPFDLPDGYALVCTKEAGVVNAQYGVAPDGSVST
jgi:hypothetical protein